MTYPNALAVILTFLTGTAFGGWGAVKVMNYGIKRGPKRLVLECFAKMHEYRPDEYHEVIAGCSPERSEQ
jgi:hypothetical protein